MNSCTILESSLLETLAYEGKTAHVAFLLEQGWADLVHELILKCELFKKTFALLELTLRERRKEVRCDLPGSKTTLEQWQSWRNTWRPIRKWGQAVSGCSLRENRSGGRVLAFLNLGSEAIVIQHSYYDTWMKRHWLVIPIHYEGGKRMCLVCCRTSRRRLKSRQAFSNSLQKPLEQKWKIEAEI